jgi:hypothetical protein
VFIASAVLFATASVGMHLLRRREALYVGDAAPAAESAADSARA